MKFSSLSEGQKGVIALVVLAWVFATMGLFVRPLGDAFALFEQTYLRIGGAFILATIVLAGSVGWKKFGSLSAKDWGILILRSVFLYLGVVCFTESLLSTKYGNTYIMNNLPLLPIFGYLFLRETLKLRTIGYIALGFTGSLLVTVTDLATFSLGYGEVMAFVAMLFFDMSYIARKWQSETLDDKETTVAMLGIGALFLFITSLAIGEGLPEMADFNLFAISMIALASAFNVINLYLTNYGFKRVKAGVGGAIIALEIVFALLYSVFVFHETLALRELVGGVLIFASVYLINRTSST